MRHLCLVLLAWYFFASGAGTAGPFASSTDCEAIRNDMVIFFSAGSQLAPPPFISACWSR